MDENYVQCCNTILLHLSTVSKKRGSGPKICDHTQKFIDDFQGTALDYYLVNKSEIYETLEMKGFQ